MNRREVPDTIGVSEGTSESLRLASKHLTTVVIPGYDLIRELGKGNFGTVWEAVREKTGQQVAIKIVEYSQDLNWDYFRRELDFLREIEDHPNTLTILDAQLDNEPPYIVMPLAQGGSLEEHVRQKQPGFELIVQWLNQTAEALSFIHRKGVIHCDVKPSNLLLSAEKSIRLADLGQARRPGHEVALGTIGFMAPEQCQEKGKRSPSISWDVYGYGATCYWLLTGRTPRMDEAEEFTLSTYLKALETEELTPIRAHNPKVDEELAAVIEACLELDPKQRYSDMNAVLTDLERWKDKEPLLCRKPWKLTYLARTALRHRSAQALIATFVMAILGAMMLWQNHLDDQYLLYMTRGIHAHESGRIEEAYLNWLEALDYRADSPVVIERLSFMPLMQIFPQKGVVNDLEVVDEGKTLLSAGADGELAKWEISTGRKLASLMHPDNLSQIDVTKDEGLIATACWDGKIRIFDTDSLDLKVELSHVVDGYAPAITTLEFCDKGRLLATADLDGRLRLWNSQSGEEKTLKGSEEDPDIRHVLASHPNRPLLGALVQPNVAAIWDLEKGELREFRLPHQSEINDLKFSLNGEFLLSGSDDGIVKLWSTETGQLIEGHQADSRVNVLCVLSENSFAVGCESGSVTIWKTSEPEPALQFYHRRPVQALKPDLNSKLMAVGTAERFDLWSDTEPNGTLSVWNIEDGYRVGGPWPHDGPVQAVRFCNRDRLVLSASGSARQSTVAHPGAARAWRYFEAELISGDAEAPPERPPMTSVSLSSGKEISHGEGIEINQIAKHLESNILATASTDRTVRLWNLETGDNTHEDLLLNGSAEAVTFDTAGESLATASVSDDAHSNVRVWEVATAYPISPVLACPGRVHQLEFSEERHSLLAKSDRGVFQWELFTSESAKKWKESLKNRLQAELDKRGTVVSVSNVSETVMTKRIP